MADDYSHFGWIAFLHAKSDAVDNIIIICNKIKVEKDCKIRKIRSDHGGEFENEKFAKFCDSHGITHQFSAPKTPQQNGVAEMRNRVIKKWLEPCLMRSTSLEIYGLKLSILHAI